MPPPPSLRSTRWSGATASRRRSIRRSGGAVIPGLNLRPEARLRRSRLLESRKLGRFRSVPDGAADRYALERRPTLRAPQEQPAAAHVAAAGERGREEQTVTKDVEERAHILVGGDAPEQDDLVVGAEPAVQGGRIADEGVAKCGLRFIDRHGRHLPQVLDTNQHIGREQAASRRDDVCPAESSGVRELPAAVEAANEREDLAE